MAAYDLLDVVNQTMRRARLINSTDDVLTTLTDAALQVDVDDTVDAINDTLRVLYSICDLMPYETSQGSITLVDGTREYALPAGLVTITSQSFMNQTDGISLVPYKGGYGQMFEDQVQPANYTGQPSRWVINPQNNMIRLDTVPQAAEAGDQYDFLYSKAIRKTLAADTFPFSSDVLDALIPAFKEAYHKGSNGELKYNADTFTLAMGQAVSALTHNRKFTSYA